MRPVLILSLLALAAPAVAQPGRSVVDPEAKLVSEVVVQGKAPGPAWWRAEAKGAVVYILGVPDGPVPPVKWDRTELEHNLAGASGVVGPPQLRAGIGDLFAFLRLRAKLKSSAPMEGTLPPALAERYRAVAARGGRSPGRFSGWQPMAAGAFLLQESRRGWSPIEPQVRHMAAGKGLRETTSARYAAMPLAQAAVRDLTPAEQLGCLGWALDDVEAGEPRARRAAEAWARGDVTTALTAPRGFDRCLLALTGGPELWDRMSQAQADDIAAALTRPGHALAVVGLRRLLAEHGVLARLAAKGVRVVGPGED